jgi:hypothetical protein
MRDRGISKYLGLGDERASRLAVTVFEFQRHEASNRAAAAVCPCGPMARATDPNTGPASPVPAHGGAGVVALFGSSSGDTCAISDNARANGGIRRVFAASLASGKVGLPSN